MKQTSFFSKTKTPAKTKRALASNQHIHLIIRSTKAKGELSLLRFESEIARLIKHQAKLAGVQIRGFVNVGNHLHCTIRFSHRSFYKKFIRSITGLIARLVLSAQKGQAKLKVGERFFDTPVFTRVLHSWRELKILDTYLVKNLYEAQYGRDMRDRFEAEGFFNKSWSG